MVQLQVGVTRASAKTATCVNPLTCTVHLHTYNYCYSSKLLLCWFCHEMTFKSTLDLRVKCLDRMKSIAGYLQQLYMYNYSGPVSLCN